MTEHDPLAVIASPPPSLSEPAACRLAHEHWGLEARCRALVSERDQNFRLETNKGERYVLKIANSAEDPRVTDFQVQALLHIENFVSGHKAPIDTPRIVPCVDGRKLVTLDIRGVGYVARIVTYLDGVPLAASPPGAHACRNLGVFLAHLGRALCEFRHPAERHPLLWDVSRALRLRELEQHVAERRVRALVTTSLDDFERLTLPAFPELRSQVIHNDFNPDNVLMAAGEPSTVTGVIDFGDMLRLPLIVDVAVAASYLRAPDDHPLAQIAAMLGGYHSVTPLAEEEIAVLFELIRARLSATICILNWRAAIRGSDDPYLQNAAATESSAEVFLQRLMGLPAGSALAVFGRACRAVG